MNESRRHPRGAKARGTFHHQFQEQSSGVLAKVAQLRGVVFDTELQKFGEAVSIPLMRMALEAANSNVGVPKPHQYIHPRGGDGSSFRTRESPVSNRLKLLDV